MALMRNHNRQGARHRNGLRIGLKVSGSVEDGGLLEYFFGKDGKECLQHGKFVQFLRDLHEEILRLEFAHYDYKSEGSISAKDFALSMIASADMRHINNFLDRVEEFDEEADLRDIRITFEEFVNFSELRKRLRPLSQAIFSHGKVNGLLTKPDFQRAAYQDEHHIPPSISSLAAELSTPNMQESGIAEKGPAAYTSCHDIHQMKQHPLIFPQRPNLM
ncbi:hypothetical protein U1Q18_028221 [Sarracenia purpurea var. burkii]